MFDILTSLKMLTLEKTNQFAFRSLNRIFELQRLGIIRRKAKFCEKE
jgi:hypothetical protein